MPYGARYGPAAFAAARKIGGWYLRNRGAFKRGKRAYSQAKTYYTNYKRVKRIAQSAIREFKEANLHSKHWVTEADVCEEDKLKILTPLQGIERLNHLPGSVGVNNKDRTGRKIYLSGFRIHYCFSAPQTVVGAGGETVKANDPHFIRLLVVQDLALANNKSSGAAWGSPASEFFSSNGLGPNISTTLPMDFGAVEPRCTKFVHPINSKRYKVLKDMKLKLDNKGMSAHDTRVGKLWVPIKKNVTYSPDYAGAKEEGDVYCDKCYHVFWWYETGGPHTDRTVGTMTADIKVLTYFKNT